jgi:hypothetical protein
VPTPARDGSGSRGKPSWLCAAIAGRRRGLTQPLRASDLRPTDTRQMHPRRVEDAGALHHHAEGAGQPPAAMAQSVVPPQAAALCATVPDPGDDDSADGRESSEVVSGPPRPAASPGLAPRAPRVMACALPGQGARDSSDEELIMPWEVRSTRRAPPQAYRPAPPAFSFPFTAWDSLGHFLLSLSAVCRAVAQAAAHGAQGQATLPKVPARAGRGACGARRRPPGQRGAGFGPPGALARAAPRTRRVLGGTRASGPPRSTRSVFSLPRRASPRPPLPPFPPSHLPNPRS